MDVGGFLIAEQVLGFKDTKQWLNGPYGKIILLMAISKVKTDLSTLKPNNNNT